MTAVGKLEGFLEQWFLKIGNILCDNRGEFTVKFFWFFGRHLGHRYSLFAALPFQGCSFK
jgi:hypothetical protein